MNKRAKRITKPIAIAAVVLTLFAACDVFIVLGFLDNDTDLTVELRWEDSSTDLDLYLTHPDELTVGATPPVYSDVILAYDEPVLGNSGFFPQDKDLDPSSRNTVYRGNTSGGPSGTEVRFLTSSSLGSTREVIEVNDIPFDYGNLDSGDYNSQSSDGPNGLPSGFDFAWVGVMEVYVWSPTGTVNGAGDAKVIVYDSDDNVLGEFPVPSDITVEGASLVRIPVFRAHDGSSARNYYQILAHTQLLTDEAQIRSISNESETVGDFFVNGSLGLE